MNTRVTAFAVCCMASPLWGCAAIGGIASKHVASDRRAQAEQRWKQVRAQVRQKLAQDHFDAGRTKEARDELRQALDLQPDRSSAFVLLAKIELQEGRLAAAREAVQAAAALPDAGAEATYVAGVIAERYHERDAARAYYARAVELNRSVPEYLLALAEVLVSLGRPAEALSLVERRLPDFDQEVGLWLFTAETCQLLGMPDGSLRAYREAARLSPGSAVIREQLGLALVSAGRYEEAIETLRPVVEAGSARRPRGSTTGIQAEARDPTLTSGESTKEEVPPAPGESAAVRHALIRCYLECGQSRPAIARIRNLVKEAPDDAHAWRLAGRAAVLGDDPALMRESAANLRRIGEATDEAAVLEAFAALRTSDPGAATEAALRAVHQRPDDVLLWCILARAYAASGDGTAARLAAARARVLAPDDALASNALGAMRMSGDPADDFASEVGDEFGGDRPAPMTCPLLDGAPGSPPQDRPRFSGDDSPEAKRPSSAEVPLSNRAFSDRTTAPTRATANRAASIRDDRPAHRGATVHAEGGSP